MIFAVIGLQFNNHKVKTVPKSAILKQVATINRFYISAGPHRKQRILR